MVRRSVLFSPGDQPELMQKAPETGADVVVFDLEDAVVPAEKDAAREAVATVLADINPDCEVCVRINPPDSGGEADIQSVLAGDGALPDSVMLPKVGTAAAVTELASALDAFGAPLPVLALLETAEGILNAQAIANVEATDAVLMGAEDLTADIGATRTDEGEEISYARQHVVLAASAAGVDAIDTLYTDFEDTAGLREDTREGVTLGYDGKMAIHPAQVRVINDAFTPDPSAVEWAERVLDARDEAAADGRGVFEVDGEMIDAPLIARAEQILERSEEAADT